MGGGGCELEIKWRLVIGCPTTLSMKLVAWTVHTNGNVAETHFCPCDFNSNQFEFMQQVAGTKFYPRDEVFP